jgi:hypothetical protein
MSVQEYLRRVLSMCDFLEGDDIKMQEELKIHGEERLRRKLEDCIEELDKLIEDPCLERMSHWQRNEIKDRLRRRIVRARELMGGQPRLELMLAERAYEGERITVVLSIRNPRITALRASLIKEGDLDIEPPFPQEVEVPPLSTKFLKSFAGVSGSGLKSLTLMLIEGKDTFTIESSIEVLEFKVDLEALPKVDSIGDGEAKVSVELRNRGSVPLTILLPSGELLLEVGEIRKVELTGRVRTDGLVEVDPIPYLDPRGDRHELHIGDLKVEAKPIARPPELELPERGAEEVGRSETVSLDLDEIFSVIAKHVIAAFLGKLIGEHFPERKEYRKPVYVEGLPYEKRGEITVIFEDPLAVVEEDRGDYVLIRKAKIAELEHVVTAEAARRLMENFRVALDSLMSIWRPFPEARLSRRECAFYESLKGIAKKEKRSIEEISKVLPVNFYIEYTIHRGRISKKTLLKVYAGACSRTEILLDRGKDDKPMSIADALSYLGLSVPTEYPAVFLLASPTGWDPSAVNMARGTSGKVLYILVDLKTGEIYHNQQEDISRSIFRALSEIMGYTAEPLVPGEEISKLDEMLLSGAITEEEYKEAQKRLLKLI